MGAQVSTTKNTNDIINEQVTKITNNVLTKNSTEVSASQVIDVSCTENAFIAALNACSQEKIDHNTLRRDLRIATGKDIGPFEVTDSSACDMCSASDINQDSTISINTDSIDNNKIAAEIKANIDSELKKQIDSISSGPLLSYSKSDIENLTKIRNSVKNSFNTNVVNETLRKFQFNQTINSSNVKLTNINQKIVANQVSKSIISNLIENDNDFSNAVVSIDSVRKEEKNIGDQFVQVVDSIGGTITGAISSISNMVGGIYIFMVLIIFAILYTFSSQIKSFVCVFPPLKLFSMLFLDCSKKK